MQFQFHKSTFTGAVFGAGTCNVGLSQETVSKKSRDDQGLVDETGHSKKRSLDDFSNDQQKEDDDDQQTEDDYYYQDGQKSPTVMAIERQLERQQRVLEVTSMSHSLKILMEGYRKMQDNRKWRLSSGKVVEDALFSFAVKCPNEHPSHSFVIDPEDKLYLDNEVFTQDELNEISEHKRRNLPPFPKDLLKYLKTFAKRTTCELRQAIEEPIEAIEGDFNSEKHHDYDWIRYAIHTVV